MNVWYRFLEDGGKNQGGTIQCRDCTHRTGWYGTSSSNDAKYATSPTPVIRANRDVILLISGNGGGGEEGEEGVHLG